MKRKLRKHKDWRELFDLSLWSPLSWVAIDVANYLFLVAPAKVAGNGWWWWLAFFGFFFFFFFFFLIILENKIKKRLKIIFEFNRCANRFFFFFFVENKVEQEKWDNIWTPYLLILFAPFFIDMLYHWPIM